jgi:hypothetical protein
VEAALKQDHFKMMSITHVDTSTAVIRTSRRWRTGAAARRVEPRRCVCSVAGEELRMSEWGVDVVLTASKSDQRAAGWRWWWRVARDASLQVTQDAGDELLL